MTITNKGEEYEIDIERVIAHGFLRKSYPLQPGDVYVDPTGVCNPFLLIQAFNEKDGFALLGMGCFTNSNPFFKTTHTTEEISGYLREKGMVFWKNINMSIAALVNNRVE